MTATTTLQLEVLDQVGSIHTQENSTTNLAGPSNAPIHDHNGASDFQTLSKGRSLIVITQLAGMSFMTSFSNGVITVGLPAMAKDLAIDRSILLWPNSAFALASGSCFLLAGSFADVVGSRSISLIGCFFIAVFSLLSGFSRTGIELIMFRALLGVASALALPSAISIVSKSIEFGMRRNIGFASIGLAMPLGFSFGLVIGGVLISSLSWRAAFFIGGGASAVLFVVGIWALPAGIKSSTEVSVWKRLRTEIDWVGACLASTCIALFSYFLATLSADIENIKKGENIFLLIFSVLLAPAFVTWMHFREKAGQPALIPNSIWKKKAFASICIMVLLSTAVANCMEIFCSLFFQEVQGLSALQASIRILPSLLVGIATNLLTGYFVNKMAVIYAVLIACGLCAGGPLLMAVINPEWPYWYDAFFAQLVSPLSADILFTIGILVVSDVFPANTQALAGAVFNTVAQLGTSIGLTVTALISVSVTDESTLRNKVSPAALMEGYRASFWTLFAWMVSACVVGGYGLRKLGKIGEKRD